MLSADWLKASLPVGRSLAGERWSAVGACALFLHRRVLWLVTANHVVDKAGPSVSVLQTRSAGEGVAVLELGEILREHGLRWVRDASRDLAATVLPRFSGVDVKAASRDLCLPIGDVVPSMLCFTVGCPYGVRGFDSGRATPLVLDGVIAGTSVQEGIVYTSAPTFPGNSGGPLLVHRSPINTAGGASFGNPTVLLAGIVVETALVPPPDDASDHPPLHLGIAKSIDAVWEMLDSDDATGLLRRVSELEGK